MHRLLWRILENFTVDCIIFYITDAVTLHTF